MVKKRLIFTLLYSQGAFMLSRNFRLQRAGDINWIKKNYNFAKIARHIDELVILNVGRDDKGYGDFVDVIKELVSFCFMPVTVGGGVRGVGEAETLFHSGADKILINSALRTSPDSVREVVQHFGSQSVVASVDCRAVDGAFQAFVENGQMAVPGPLEDYLATVIDLGVGEVYLNSMDKDGTGQGYDLSLLAAATTVTHARNIPLILAGGAGNSRHLLAGIQHPDVDAVATANIFNFIGEALPKARQALLAEGVPLAVW